MRIKKSNVIGEGGYGCIHKPSLFCKPKSGKKYIYKNRVSKTFFRGDADVEIQQYDKMKRIDKEQKYFLGPPVECEMDNNNKYNIDSLNECSNADEIIKNQDQIQILIMKDAGIDLEKLGDIFEKSPVNKENTKQVFAFWKESFRLLLGLKEMSDHGLIHNDLKPQNITYNINKKRVNYIDFGIMETRKDIIDLASNNNYRYNVLHWSFPFETIYYNYRDFKLLYSMNDNKRKNAMKMVLNSTPIKTFLLYLYSIFDEKETVDLFLNDMNDFFFNSFYYPKINDYLMDRESDILQKYNDFLFQSTETFDIYGLGIALNYMLLKTKKYFSKNGFYEEMKQFLYRTITPNVFKRIRINEMIYEYESILIKYKILEINSTKFDNVLFPKERKENLYTNIRNSLSVVSSINKKYKTLKYSKKQRRNTKKYKNYYSIIHPPEITRYKEANIDESIKFF